jgi:hypothetical protein
MITEVYPSDKRTQFAWVTDKTGNEFVCPVDALRDPQHVSEEELKNCIDSARSPQPYAGG